MTGVSLREGVAWMRAHLLGDTRMVRDAPVRLYVTGERRWRELSDWPPPDARERTYYLQAGGGLTASALTMASEPSRYRYDPARPTPALGGATLLERTPIRDNRPLEAREDVLTFTTAPLDADVDVDALVRLTPDEPPRDDDDVAAVRFELWPTAHRFAGGHRIRVQVSSGAHPRYARNPGTGEDPVRATRLVAADQEVFHDARRPSSVILTV